MQVTRRRRRVEKDRPGLLGHHAGHRLRIAAASSATLALIATGIASASTDQFGTDQVGEVTDNGQVISSDQYLKPIGDRLVVDNGKIMASSVSPDGSHLAALTTDGGIALTIVDLRTWTVQQLVGNSATANLRIPGNDVGQEGPSYSPDGKSLWMSVSVPPSESPAVSPLPQPVSRTASTATAPSVFRITSLPRLPTSGRNIPREGGTRRPNRRSNATVSGSRT